MNDEMTWTEQRVASIYQDMLDIAFVGPSDELLALGCDSLQAVRIALEIERAFQVELPIEIMESSGQVREVAAWIDARVADAGQPKRPS